MSLQIENVHIGRAIAMRLAELKISKSELGRRIGIPQQHINRMLEKDSIDTARLVAVCNAMDFNFFTLYIKAVQEEISAYIPTLAMSGAKVQNNVGKNKVTNHLCSFSKEEREGLEKRIKSQQEQIEQKDAQIQEKDTDIRDLKEEVLLLRSELSSKDAQMALHRVNIQSKDDTIEQLKSNVKSKDDIIALLQRQLEKYEQQSKERRQEQ